MDRGMSRQQWALWLGGVLALAGLVFGVSGYVMAASEVVAHPGRAAYLHRLAYMHLGRAGASTVALLVSAVALLRRRARGAAGDTAQSA